MTVQVLISTMHQKDHSLLDRMNIQTDAIVVNQCDKNQVESFEYRGRRILWISCKERGVGLSRNTALMRASGDIVVFADDDVTYEDNYEEKILREFQRLPNSAMIVFNIRCHNGDRYEKETVRTHRVRFYSSLSYGAYRFAVKRSFVFHRRVCFSELFGGGCVYSAGEDNIFLNDILKKGGHVYASEVNLGDVTHSESTWFTGFGETYFYDLGHLMYSIFGKLSYPYTLIMLLKNRKIYNQPLKMMWKNVCDGAKDEKAAGNAPGI